jgi:hypothetical protein|tara:strand:- start:326 stop:559 length:234 start_codon:yes stop_codon:yes gene_type:complete
MNSILNKVNETVGGLTTLVMSLLSLAILVEVIYGAGIFGMGVVGNVVKLINSMGSSGFVGLLSLIVLLTLFKGKEKE